MKHFIDILGYEMDVPDIITLGAYTSTVHRHHQDDYPSRVRMIVPERIRFGNNKQVLFIR
jgi:hypothetical protein